MISHAFHRTFDEALAVELKQADRVYLLYASSGAFTLDVGERRWLLPPQRAALLAPGTPMRVTSKGPATASSVLFDPALFTALGPCHVFPMTDLARLMVAHACRWDASRDAEDADANCFFAALAVIVRERLAFEEESWLPRPRSAGVEKALDRVLETLDLELDLASVAEVAALSERTLARRLSDEIGMGLREFRARARMIKAMAMLGEGRATITEIGYACGFRSTSSFIKAFRAFSALTPRQYRVSTQVLSA